MFEILYNHICLIEVDMAVVVKWLTHQIVALAFVGSIPIDRPIYIFSRNISHFAKYSKTKTKRIPFHLAYLNIRLLIK